jgi:hypothetical protein
MKILNVVSYGKITNDILLKKIFDLLSSSNDKRLENYTYKNLDLENHLSFDALTTDDNEIICFSGLYSRPGWGEGIYRSSNRTFVNPKFRNKFYDFYNPKYIVPHQVTTHRDKIKIVFNSREHYKSEFYFKKAKNEVEFYHDWIVMDGMIRVVPVSYKKSAYQKVMFKSFNMSFLPFDVISVNEWKNLTE